MMTHNYYRKAWAVIGYSFHADVYCADCGETLPDVDPEGNDKHPIFASDELDYEYEGETIRYYCAKCDLPFSEW